MKRRIILEFKDGGGYVSLNRRYFPPHVKRNEDPLDADRYETRKDALESIGGVFKEKPENYKTRRIKEEIL